MNCSGLEAEILQCSTTIFDNALATLCGPFDSVAVVCQGKACRSKSEYVTTDVDVAVCVDPGIAVAGDCSDGELRLEGGSSIFEGRVEICINNAWGGVCDAFTRSEALVVCRGLGLLQSEGVCSQ